MSVTVSRQIGELLKWATEPGSANTISGEEVRAWMSELIDDYAEEFARKPELAARPLWDLVAADTDPGREALFVAAVLHANGVRVAAGRGPAAAVRRFGDSEFPADATRLIDELGRRFAMTRSVTFTRQEVDVWLGRG